MHQEPAETVGESDYTGAGGKESDGDALSFLVTAESGPDEGPTITTILELDEKVQGSGVAEGADTGEAGRLRKRPPTKDARGRGP